MNEFTHEMFGTLRTVEVDGEPVFLLSSPAKALGYRDAEQAVRLLRDSQFNTISGGIKADLGLRGRDPYVVTEGGLYRLIMRSDSKHADVFQDWVTDEVLPAIRKHGGYLADSRTTAQNARFAEMIQYREAQDMITLATDYVPSSAEAARAFTRIQDMLYVKVTGMHAPELKATREIKTWKGKTGPTVADRKVAKNYLSPDELTQLAGYGKLVVGSLQVAYPSAGYTVEKFWSAVADIARRY